MDELDQIRAARALVEKHMKVIESKRGKKVVQTDIARETGLSQSVIANYLKGYVIGGKFDAVVVFLDWLGLDPRELAEAVDLYAYKKDPQAKA